MMKRFNISLIVLLLAAVLLAGCKKEEPKTGSINGHNYVDLDLPSGNLWATCNVGANAAEGYGNYFAWGETQPKGTYNMSTYVYSNGDNFSFTKYCNDAEFGYNGFTDGLTELQASDDAASVHWGSGWRTPTKEEWEELRQYTTYGESTQNGVKGCLFTASNGGSIFIPLAGLRWNDELYYNGTSGYVWSSTLHGQYPFMPRVFGLWWEFEAITRDYGLPVRPVHSAQ